MPPLSNPSEKLSNLVTILQSIIAKTGFTAQPTPTASNQLQVKEIMAALVNPMIESARKIAYNRGVQWGEDLCEEALAKGVAQGHLRVLIEKLLEVGDAEGIAEAFVDGVKAGVKANIWGA